jgi:hypothetical protein
MSWLSTYHCGCVRLFGVVTLFICSLLCGGGFLATLFSVVKVWGRGGLGLSGGH